MQFPREKSPSERGAAMVELAIVTPLLLVLGFGALNLGTALREKQIAVDAARYGARRAAAEVGYRCDESGGANAFASCEEILNLFSSDLPPSDSRDLAAFHTCTYLSNSGLSPNRWEVAPVLDVETTFPTVSSIARRNEPVQLGGAFPNGGQPLAQASFVLEEDCHED